MGMGGGFMNVPREIIPRQNQGLKLFAVPPETVSIRSSDLSHVDLSRNVDEQAPQTAAAPVIPKVDPIHLNIAPGADVRDAWEKFFVDHDPKIEDGNLNKLSPDEIRAHELRRSRQRLAIMQTVQELKDAAAEAVKHGKTGEATKKHEEIIALVEAALRHDQAQPWMYELLAMSMTAAGRPKADIDRAIMSIAEFTKNSSDLMYLGAYLVKAKMERRALTVFHEVSQIEPFWPEPYVHGMAVSRQIDDLEGLEWSTAGILGQAWPPEGGPRCGATRHALPLPSARPSANSSVTNGPIASGRPLTRPWPATASSASSGTAMPTST